MQRRLVGLLIRRGTSRETAEDVGQEVAIRAYRAMPAFTSADELVWWCSTVARRLVIDEHRRSSRLSLVAAVAEGTSPSDGVAGDYERKELVRAVLAEFERLPEEQKLAFASRGSRAEPSTIDVRRHRARRRLLAVVEAFGAVFGWWAARWRSVRPGLALASTSVAVSALLMVEIGTPPSRNHPAVRGRDAAPSIPSVRIMARPARGPVRVAHGDRSTTTVPPGRRLTLDPPVRPRVSQATPGRGSIDAGVDQGPERAPLWCLWVKAPATAYCVDYPVRP
ncbi:MAG: hypothetical protein QOF40_2681 [Actinomycetota bacterium]|nr:hypothetical protein [Actinomycetota bacterium]